MVGSGELGFVLFVGVVATCSCCSEGIIFFRGYKAIPVLVNILKDSPGGCRDFTFAEFAISVLVKALHERIFRLAWDCQDR